MTISGPCTYCGSDHWRPDCQKLKVDINYAIANAIGTDSLVEDFLWSKEHPEGTHD